MAMPAAQAAPAAPRASGRGRQPAAIEDLRDLVDELTAERAEGRELAETALDAARFIEAYYDRPQVVMHHAGRISFAARRFLRQRATT